jgi:hypothetical protein
MSFGISPDVPPQEGDVLPPVAIYPSVFAGLAVLAASASPQLVDSFDSGIFRATEYTLTVSQGSSYQVAKIILMCDGPNSFIEVYALMSSTGVPLATFSASVTAGVVANLAVTLVTVAAATVNFQAIRVLA